MSDYIFIRKSRNALSSLLHFVFNLALGIGSIVLTVITGSWLLGFLLVLLSKWRMFAVRPRYWFLNLKLALVDLIVGTSIVLLAYTAGTTVLPLHYLLAAFYCIWLIFIKPKSGETAAETQALIAVFLGSAATVQMTASANALFLSLIIWIICYGATRHVFVQSDDKEFTLITLTTALVGAEIAWLSHAWLIVYQFNFLGLIIPQLSLILTLLAFAFNRVYKIILKKDGRLKWNDVSTPVIFCTLLLAIVIIWFSKPIFNV